MSSKKTSGRRSALAAAAVVIVALVTFTLATSASSGTGAGVPDTPAPDAATPGGHNLFRGPRRPAYPTATRESVLSETQGDDAADAP